MGRVHVFPLEFELLLAFLAGGCWILTYLILIYRGYKDKHCGMPFAALCGNITWEFIFSFIFPQDSPAFYIIYIWFALDIIILLQFIFYSGPVWPKPLSGWLFLPSLIIALATAFCIHYLFAIEFQHFDGIYTAYGLNLMMSILFVTMLIRTNTLKGQSMWIAIFKWVGSLFASLLNYSLYPESDLLLFLYGSTFFFDAVYAILLYDRKTGLTHPR